MIKRWFKRSRLSEPIYTGCREVKWAWQRVFRGWDDRVIWSIDWYLAENIPVWVRALKETKTGVSGACFDWNNEDFDKAQQKQDEIFDAIIEGFESYNKLDSTFDQTVRDQLQLKFKRGFKLFRKYYSSLWD